MQDLNPITNERMFLEQLNLTGCISNSVNSWLGNTANIFFIFPETIQENYPLPRI